MAHSFIQSLIRQLRDTKIVTCTHLRYLTSIICLEQIIQAAMQPYMSLAISNFYCVIYLYKDQLGGVKSTINIP